MLRSVWYLGIFAGVTLLCVNVLLSVEFGLFILIFEYSFCNVIGVFQAARNRRLDSAWLGAIVLGLCGLGSWRACVRFRYRPCRYGETPWTGSGLAWLGRRKGVSIYA